MVAFSFSFIVALKFGADIGDQVSERPIRRHSVADGLDAVQDGRVVPVTEQVRDALRAERTVPLRHRPAQVGPHQIHAELAGLVDRDHPVAGAEPRHGQAAFVGDHAPDAPRLGHLLSSQALQRLLLIGCERCHVPILLSILVGS